MHSKLFCQRSARVEQIDRVTYTTRKRTKHKRIGLLRSFRQVAYKLTDCQFLVFEFFLKVALTYVIGMEAKRVTRVYASCLIDIRQELVSKPRLRTTSGVTLFTAL